MGRISQTFEEMPIDRKEIGQNMLDLENKGRTNLFPWRGQFSPGLVEVLLGQYACDFAVIFDPFAGVATTLFEAGRKGLSACGAEINPAAVAMAETVHFLPLPEQRRREVIQSAADQLGRSVGSGLPLFQEQGDRGCAPQLVADLVAASKCVLERNLLTNALIRALEQDAPVDANALFRAFRQHAQVVLELPLSAKEYGISNSDARELSAADSSIDLVITSPPYINVFNYHQNNRPAMELLGWDLLHVAKSEFGSNRKHRGNRFLTVVQYCLDMFSALVELRRVLKKSGRAIFVVGRVSTVRGISFQNGLLVATLAQMAGLSLVLRQERKFKNKFGELIYEDILHLAPAENCLAARPVDLAVQELESGLNQRQCVGAVKTDLHQAICSAPHVQPSPSYRREQPRNCKSIEVGQGV